MINTKELCKLIKSNGVNGTILWKHEGEQDFITNRSFLVRFEKLPNDVLAALFGLFYKLPLPSETFMYQLGKHRSVDKPLDFKSIYLPEQQNIEGETTSFLKDIGQKKTARVIKFPEYYGLIDANYMKLAIDNAKPKTKGNSPVAPIYFCDGDLMILPYRMSEKDTINETIGGFNEQIQSKKSNRN